MGKIKGKTLSPRPELKKEFQTETEQSFHMYQSDRFLEFATKYLNEEINENAIQEIRDLRRLDERKRLRELRRQKEYFKYKERREELLKQRILLEEELKFIEDKRGFIESALEEQYLILDNSDPSAFDDSKMKMLKRDLHAMNRKADHINSNIEEIKRQEFKERIIRNKTMHNKELS